ncbi:uncharacterized protein LOC113138612 [Mastacembelus armatus]|uniref:uncharacterized protein LOC113138612 n=1 Tax=Mastacembelus armatus TaxID=205130 RepID=UPI000E4543C9|nr:uncharacterized protein LOC113138612 [Mastacembelus armatus]
MWRGVTLSFVCRLQAQLCAIMSPCELLVCCVAALSLTCLQAAYLQCFGCNVRGEGLRGYVELGCRKPEIINCSQTEKGFKLRSCITTYSQSPDLLSCLCVPVESPDLLSCLCVPVESPDLLSCLCVPVESPDLLSCLRSISGPESLDLVLSRGCATSRHCQQAELPGVSITCCDWSLCNVGKRWAGSLSGVIISFWLPLQGH